MTKLGILSGLYAHICVSTCSTWYQTEVPPKSTWKSVYESAALMSAYLVTVGFSTPSGGGLGHRDVTQHSFRTM